MSARGTIVLDPGHGGSHVYGKSTPHGATGLLGAAEKDVNLELAKRVANRLGDRVVLTRSQDCNLSLADRIEVARRRNAHAFVSIHSNARSRNEGDVDVWVHPRGTHSSLQLAHAIAGRFGGSGGGAVYQGELAVLQPSHHGTGVAACLVQANVLDALSERWGGYGDGDAMLDGLADCIAHGISTYIYGAKPLVEIEEEEEEEEDEEEQPKITVPDVAMLLFQDIRKSWTGWGFPEHGEQIDKYSNCGETARSVGLAPISRKHLAIQCEMFAGTDDVLKKYAKNALKFNNTSFNMIKKFPLVKKKSKQGGHKNAIVDVREGITIRKYTNMNQLALLQELTGNQIALTFCETRAHVWVHLKIRLDGVTYWLYGDGNYGEYNFYWRKTNEKHTRSMLLDIAKRKLLPAVPTKAIKFGNAPFKMKTMGQLPKKTSDVSMATLQSNAKIASVPSFRRKSRQPLPTGVTMVTRVFSLENS